MNSALFAGLMLVPFLSAGQTKDTVPPANKRFAAAQGEEVPSFQRHVLPLMGRLGCNGRACHGSFQGQGGFRLSLFGYDFEADHASLLGGDLPRVETKSPELSLALQKPTLGIPHKGGKRMDKGSWQYHLLLRWIRGGAVPRKEADADFISLHVEPREIVFEKNGHKAQLKVTARWSDGTIEDVTPLCRFKSNDETVAEVDDDGLVSSVGKGGTDVVAFYDNGVVPVQVIRAVSDRVGSNYPQVPTPTRIDELVVGRLKKLGIVPSGLSSDVEFLRRVSLDITGTLPTPAEVEAFLADKSSTKRARKIDELLETPAYAAWWTTRLSDWTGNTPSTGALGGERMLNLQRSQQWYQWIYRRVAENEPYDKLVAGIMLARSRQVNQSFEDYCKEMSSYFRDEDPADFSKRDDMFYYWMRKTTGGADAKALAVAYSFLGVSLQCAQCHKHPYDQWTKQDFEEFAAFFNTIGYRDRDRKASMAMKKKLGLTADQDSGGYGRLFLKLAKSGTVLPFAELIAPEPSKTPRRPRPIRRGGRVITPRHLGGTEAVAALYDDPRKAVMDWMREAENPYFAKAFVNRVWAGYFNVGIIDPTDDLNLANPPSNPALLEYLAGEFVRRGYDMKWLHREIASSRTYQLSWRPNDTNRHDERNFSRSVVRRLPSEVLYDALRMVTAGDAKAEAMRKDPVKLRAIGHVQPRNRNTDNYAVKLFGEPARILNCDCERSAEPSLLQIVYLRNDKEVLGLLDAKDGWLKSTTAKTDSATLVRQAYLRILSRPPQDEEARIALEHLTKADDRMQGLRDLIWALINTKEFVVNR